MKKAILFFFLLNFCSINIIHAQLFGWLIISSNASSLPTITTTAVKTIYSTTARNINGVAFDGSVDITIAAAASAEQLTGTTLKSNITGSSLTSVGTLTNLTVTNPYPKSH